MFAALATALGSLTLLPIFDSYGWLPRVALVMKTSSASRSSSRVMRCCENGIWLRRQSSITLARVMPSRIPTSGGGVRTCPPATRKTLLVEPSAMLPSPAHRIAS